MRRSLLAPLNRSERKFGLMALCAPFVLAIFTSMPFEFALFLGIIFSGAVIFVPRYQNSKKPLFLNEKFNELWSSSEERYQSLLRVFKSSKPDSSDELASLPASVEAIRKNLYHALVRADEVTCQLNHLENESSRFSKPNVHFGPGSDSGARAFLAQADKNVAEYRQNLKAVQAGVQRTEAQTVLFMTTVDNLRVRMVGYGLRGRPTEAPNYEYSGILAEVHSQLQSIDQALEELNLPLFPSDMSRLAKQSSKPNPVEELEPLQSPPPCIEPQTHLTSTVTVPIPESPYRHLEGASQAIPPTIEVQRVQNQDGSLS